MTLDFYFLLFLVRRRILLGRIITANILKSRHRKGDNSNMRKVVWHLINKVQVKIRKIRGYWLKAFNHN